MHRVCQAQYLIFLAHDCGDCTMDLLLLLAVALGVIQCRPYSDCQWRDIQSPVEIYRIYYSQLRILVLVKSHLMWRFRGPWALTSPLRFRRASEHATSTSGILEGQFVTTLHHQRNNKKQKQSCLNTTLSSSPVSECAQEVHQDLC